MFNHPRRRLDNPLADLAKVVVKRKGSLNSKTLHHRKTGAINEAQSLVTVSLKDFPGLSFIGRRHMDNRKGGFDQQPTPKERSRFIAQPHPDQRDGFMHDNIAGKEGCRYSLNVLASSCIIPVGLVRERKER